MIKFEIIRKKTTTLLIIINNYTLTIFVIVTGDMSEPVQLSFVCMSAPSHLSPFHLMCLFCISRKFLSIGTSQHAGQK